MPLRKEENLPKYSYFVGIKLVLILQQLPLLYLQHLFSSGSSLTATQILVINILMDGPPAVALGMEKKHGDVMKRPPRLLTRVYRMVETLK